MTASQSSSVMFTNMRSRRMPALFTSDVHVAEGLGRVARGRRGAIHRRDASATGRPPPAAVISSATAGEARRHTNRAVGSAPLSLTTTFAPSAANRSACSRPMPAACPRDRSRPCRPTRPWRQSGETGSPRQAGGRVPVSRRGRDAGGGPRVCRSPCRRRW